MVISMWGRSLLDVWVREKADASSDHHLVTAKAKLKLRAAKQNNNTTPGLDMTSADYKNVGLKMRNMFWALSNIDDQGNKEEVTVNQRRKQMRNLSGDAED